MKNLFSSRILWVGLLAGVIVVLLAITRGRLQPAPPAPPPRSPAAVTPPPSPAAPEEDLVLSDPRLTAAREALKRHDFSAAYRLSETARKQGAELPAVLELQAALFKATDYLDKEMATLRQWTATAPQEVRPWIKLFYIYLDLGWRQEADNASKRALELAPTNARSHVARAIFHYRSSSPELAIQPIAEARRLDPSNKELVNLQETIFIKTRHFSEAETEVRKSLKTPPQTQEQLMLVQALLGQNKAQEAESLLREVQGREPDNLEAAYELGIRAEKRGDLEEAKRQFEKITAQDARYNNVLWRLGRIYTQQGRTEEGRKLREAFETMEKHTSDYETAQRRLHTRSNDPLLHSQLAKFHLEAEEYPQAIVELRRVLELRPKDKQARQDLIQALKRHGRVTEARQMEKQGLGIRD